MAPTLGNTALEMVRVGKHVSLTPYVMDGETEALRRDLSHSDFGVESVIGLNFQLRKKKNPHHLMRLAVPHMHQRFL